MFKKLKLRLASLLAPEVVDAGHRYLALEAELGMRPEFYVIKVGVEKVTHLLPALNEWQTARQYLAFWCDLAILRSGSHHVEQFMAEMVRVLHGWDQGAVPAVFNSPVEVAAYEMKKYRDYNVAQEQQDAVRIDQLEALGHSSSCARHQVWKDGTCQPGCPLYPGSLADALGALRLDEPSPEELEFHAQMDDYLKDLESRGSSAPEAADPSDGASIEHGAIALAEE